MLEEEPCGVVLESSRTNKEILWRPEVPGRYDNVFFGLRSPKKTDPEPRAPRPGGPIFGEFLGPGSPDVLVIPAC